MRSFESRMSRMRFSSAASSGVASTEALSALRARAQSRDRSLVTSSSQRKRSSGIDALAASSDRLGLAALMASRMASVARCMDDPPGSFEAWSRHSGRGLQHGADRGADRAADVEGGGGARAPHLQLL